MYIVERETLLPKFEVFADSHCMCSREMAMCVALISAHFSIHFSSKK